MATAVDKKRIIRALQDISRLKDEVSKVVIGQKDVVDNLIKALISNGHVLIEGVPGVAKTLIIKTLAATLGCDFKRIQFTIDLLPADIVGFTTFSKDKGFEVVQGPVFTNFLIADEINRATPKTQSALLEAMQEKQVTIGNETFRLSSPFFVIANNNPLESEGVYPLPEAQIDRFLFKLDISYPRPEEERVILSKNVTLSEFEDFDINEILSGRQIENLQKLVKDIYLDTSIEKYIIRLINATRANNKYKTKLSKYINWGASPRASIGLYIAGKANALMKGRSYVVPQDIKDVSLNVLRHRVLLNYEGQAEGIKREDLIDEILKSIPVP